MTILTQDLERLRALVEKQSDPAWVSVLNVLRQKCPCTLADLKASYLPYEEFPVTCKRCYIRGRHTNECDCQGTDYILRPQWQHLADEGMPWAVEAVLFVVVAENRLLNWIPRVELHLEGSHRIIQALTEMLEETP